MAESKRIFAKGRMNRDIDDRLLPEGEYRDALNVNVGKSEGGDIGAVENLKGNMEIPNQTGISGTTIGVVRDPNEDRIYWFNTSDTADGIYEYDQSTGEVNTLVQDIKRDVPLPTCAPTITIAAIEPDSITPNRPGLPGLPAVPTGVCTDTNATNTGVASDATRTFQNNSLCQYPVTFNCVGNNTPTATCTDPGNGSGAFKGLDAETDCNNNCNRTDPGGGGGGGQQAIRVAVEGAACGTTGNTDPTIDLTVQVTQGNPGFPVTVDIANGPSGIELTALNTPVTFTVNNPGDNSSVAYRPSATESGGRRSTINIVCTVGWGTAVLPSASFDCDGAGTGSCSDPGDGTGAFSDRTTCEEDADCVAPVVSTTDCLIQRFSQNDLNNPVPYSVHYFQCNSTCSVTEDSFDENAPEQSICIQRVVATPCDGVSQTITGLFGGKTLTVNALGYVVSDTLDNQLFSEIAGSNSGIACT